MALLPLLQRVILVVQAESLAIEPPLHDPTNRGAVTPAVSVAAALASMRVVNPS
jgi:hypothetical protein